MEVKSEKGFLSSHNHWKYLVRNVGLCLPCIILLSEFGTAQGYPASSWELCSDAGDRRQLGGKWHKVVELVLGKEEGKPAKLNLLASGSTTGTSLEMGMGKNLTIVNDLWAWVKLCCALPQCAHGEQGNPGWVQLCLRLRCGCHSPGSTWGLQEALLALAFIHFINAVDDGGQRMFIECLQHTLQGDAISISEGRTRVQTYLEELKKLWKIAASAVRSEFCAWGNGECHEGRGGMNARQCSSRELD